MNPKEEEMLMKIIENTDERIETLKKRVSAIEKILVKNDLAILKGV